MAVESRVDRVGSLLRPQALLDARARREPGEIVPDEFKRVEDDAVRGVVGLQEECGCVVVTDGVPRRDSFQSEITAACAGFENSAALSQPHVTRGARTTFLGATRALSLV